MDAGTAGEQEHGNAAKTTAFGNPFREGFGGGKAWLPSTTKRCAPGASVDVPLCYKDEIWVRSHYDTITIQVEVWARRHRNGEDIKVTEGRYTYVAMDDMRRPRQIPPQ